MSELSVRWKQRFQNFQKSFLLLEESIKIEDPSVTERAGLIQFFEMTFELAWKLLKDYEEEEGFVIRTPREAIKQAFQAKIISDGHQWIDGLKDRNLTTHTYQEKIAREIEEKIRGQYFPMLKKLHITFKKNIS